MTRPLALLICLLLATACSAQRGPTPPRAGMTPWEASGQAVEAGPQALPTCEWLSEPDNLLRYIVWCARRGWDARLPAGVIRLTKGDQFPRWRRDNGDKTDTMAQGVKVIGAGVNCGAGMINGGGPTGQKNGWWAANKLGRGTTILCEGLAEPVFTIQGMGNEIRDLTICGGWSRNPRSNCGVHIRDQKNWGTYRTRLENVRVTGFSIGVLNGRPGEANAAETRLIDCKIDGCLAGFVNASNQSVCTWARGLETGGNGCGVWIYRGGFFEADLINSSDRIPLRVDSGGPNVSPVASINTLYLDAYGSRPPVIDMTNAKWANVAIGSLKYLSHVPAPEGFSPILLGDTSNNLTIARPHHCTWPRGAEPNVRLGQATLVDAPHPDPELPAQMDAALAAVLAGELYRGEGQP